MFHYGAARRRKSYEEMQNEPLVAVTFFESKLTKDKVDMIFNKLSDDWSREKMRKKRNDIKTNLRSNLLRSDFVRIKAKRKFDAQTCSSNTSSSYFLLHSEFIVTNLLFQRIVHVSVIGTC